MADRMKIGLVGAGPVATRYHLSAIRGVPEVLPAIVIDADAQRAREFALRHGFPRWSADLGELADCAEMAIVGVPNGWHAQVSRELLLRGIHVLCEKPMARNPAECQSMIDAARQSGALLCIGHNRRFRNHLQLLRDLLRKGLIGDVVKVEAEEGSTSDWPRSPAYFDPVQSGGGSLMDVGIHSIDLIRWLAGEFQEVDYTGNGTEQKVESDAELRFRLANGATGRVVSSRSRDLAQQLTITGSEGFLQAGLWGDGLRIRCDKGKPFRHLPHLDAFVSRRPPADPSFVNQLQNFLGAIRGENELLVTGEEGMAAVEVVCRAYASAAPSSPSGAQATVATR